MNYYVQQQDDSFFILYWDIPSWTLADLYIFYESPPGINPDDKIGLTRFRNAPDAEYFLWRILPAF